MKRCYVAGLVLAFALAGCSSGTISGTGSGTGQPSKGPAAVVTTADARKVLTQHAAGLNQALHAGETSVLAQYVGGSSYTIRATAFKDPTIKQTPAQTFSRPRFYIPFQTTYPAWFVARVHQQASDGTSQDDYLVFTKASASAPWLDVFEPVVIVKATQPTVATDKNGNAVAVPASQAGQLALAPDALPAAQAKYLDPVTPAAGAGRPCPPGTSKPLAAKLGCTLTTPTTATGSAAVTFSDGSTIVDLHDRSVFTSHGSGEIAITNRHTATSDPVYALRTTDGGALVFYDLSASMVLSPAGAFAGLFSIDYPDLITKGKNQDASFEVDYREQFAVDEPQGTPAKPAVVAQFGGASAATCGGGPCK
ncbi:MAG TPA: hypothetical protein VFW65_16795 [Pseudonocardiaceae bacterium]|nr:hypothetical protein [Pseudonocardiaceae bacterium]